MTTSFHRESAKIYQFPVKSAAQAEKRIDPVKALSELKTMPYVETTFASVWYHEAAIRDSEPTRNN